MRNWRRMAVLLALVAAGGMLWVACNQSDDVPTVSSSLPEASSPTTPAPTQAASPTPEATPDPCEGDASCGKGISGEFLSNWDLKVQSTNAHDNNGTVCATNGFQGPVIGSYPWRVKGTSNPNKPSESITPFQGGVLKLSDWKADECSREVKLQLDAIRGSDCNNMGWLMAVLFPSNRTKYTIKREPGEWVEGQPTTTYGEWSDCTFPKSATASMVAPQCTRSRTVTITHHFTRKCSEETKTEVETKTETEPCTCKVTCDDNKPTITGDISSDVQPTQVVFDLGSVGPSGGTFNPTLPKAVPRPAYGQPDGSFSTVYTLPYGPAELKCTVEKEFTKSVSPQDCQKYNRFVISSDPDLPGSGESFFNYVIYKKGRNDAESAINFLNPIWRGKLPKHTDQTVNFAEDGNTYYGQYDAEFGGRDKATATCPVVSAQWHVKLRYECGCVRLN